VKQKIEVEHKMQADLMKLIAYGKVMEDDTKTLKDYSIKEGDFIVVMISKVKSDELDFCIGKASTQEQARGCQDGGVIGSTTTNPADSSELVIIAALACSTCPSITSASSLTITATTSIGKPSTHSRT
jgi:Ubiquitin family